MTTKKAETGDRIANPLRPAVWHPAVLLATWFGAGLLPVAPGTWGSLAALPFAWAIRELLGRAGPRHRRRARLPRRLVGGGGASPRRAASRTPARSSSTRSPRNGWCCSAAPLDPAGLGARLPAVPHLRHLEAVAGALGRPPHPWRLRHHARRSAGGGLRCPRLVGAVGDWRSIRCSTAETLDSRDIGARLPAAPAAGMSATAESCTGGLVAAALTAIAGSSDVVERGFVTYSNEAKIGTARRARRRRSPRMARSAPRPRRRWPRARSPVPRSISRCRSPASPAPAAAAPRSRSASSISGWRGAAGHPAPSAGFSPATAPRCATPPCRWRSSLLAAEARS